VSDGVPGPEQTCDNDGLILASRIREARTAIGLTQEDVATAMRIGRSAISAIETGDRKVSGTELCRFARLYRRPVAWLLGDDDPEISDDLIAATVHLSERDRDAVIAFARFLAHQGVTR
jgi:transcriptional regulator with XRE-family HTH domain